MILLVNESSSMHPSELSKEYFFLEQSLSPYKRESESLYFMMDFILQTDSLA